MRFFDEEISAIIREQSLSSEQSGELSPQVLDYIYERGLFKLFVPEELNGLAANLPKAIKIFEESSFIDGSFGWLVTIGSGGGYFAPIFSPEASVKLFSADNAVVAGSGHPSGTARYAEGGYKVTGSWRYSSGANYATIFTANCLLPDGTIASFIFTPDQVSVTKDWNAFGLKATASHTISVSDVFVPEDMTFDIAGGERYYRHPIYHYPFIQFAEASFAAVNIGICRHFFEEALRGIQQHRSPDSETRYNFVHDIIVKQYLTLKEASEHFYETLEKSWEELLHKEKINDELLNDVSRSAKNVVSVALSAAQKVYPYLGLSVTMEHSPLNRCWRDLHTASQHILLKTFE